MPTVTVAGANGQTVTLSFDTDANAILASKLAAAISAGVQAGTIVPASDTEGPPPPLNPGQTGEWVQTNTGFTALSPGYKAVVDNAPNAVIFGSGDADESVLSGAGNLTFVAAAGSGTVVAGGGNNSIILLPTDKGNWSINTGNGDDNILAMGSNDTINAGGGHNAIMLSNGSDVVTSTGDDTVLAGSGLETITALPGSSDVVYGDSSQLFFVGTLGGPATIYGGSGSDTFFGGTGPNLVYGGTSGNNFLFAGTGAATLFGGGNGDELFAQGSAGQALHAGAGNETLFGGFASGADTFYGSAGRTEMVGGSGNDTFVFTNGQAGGNDLIQGFTSGPDKIDLQGYGSKEVSKALDSQVQHDGSVTITLSDHTRITFAGISSLSASDFITSGGGTSGKPGGKGGGGDGSKGHGSHDPADPSHIRDAAFGKPGH